jgi:hypothetical protein
MIIDDLDLEGVAIVETKYDSPWAVDADRPKPGAVATQFVQADTAQACEIVQLSRDVQGGQAPPRERES